MWEVVTSNGHRVRDIRHESDALRTVHALGITTLIAPGRYFVTDGRGRRFMAEIHRQTIITPVRDPLPPYR